MKSHYPGLSSNDPVMGKSVHGYFISQFFRLIICKMLGYGASDDYSHDYIDDDVLEEKDADNDETFGADVVPDTEWEIEDLAQQTETIESSYKRNGTKISAYDNSITAMCNNLEAQEGYTNYQAFAMESIEKSLYDLVEEDDEPGVSSPIVKAKNNFHSCSTMSNNLSTGSFFDLYPESQSKSAQNIWGHHYHTINATLAKKPTNLANLPPLIPEKAAFFQAQQSSNTVVADEGSKNSLNFLLSKLSTSNTNNIGPTLVTPKVNETNKVKTVQEIEAELLAMTKQSSNSLNDTSSSSVIENVKSELSKNSEDIK
uniref:Uncharacterized protein n=1 Tax=Romanomermis culicivorax TaxID=13658 RepID=A0A915KM19_ROMCU